MRVGSLFSGAGGFDLGLERAGMSVAWQCEIDRHARMVLRRHWPETSIFEDVREVNGAALPPVDVLCFGSPCQDLSVAGKRAGLDGARSGLFFEAMRIVDEMGSLPRVAIWENVPGALSSNGGEDFAAILTEMGKRWRGIAYRVLDAQFFGVAQRRRRVFVVGHSGGGASAAEILSLGQSLRGNPPARGKAGADITQSLTRCLGAGGAALNACRTASGRQDFETETFIALHLMQDPIHSRDQAPCLGQGSPSGQATVGVAVSIRGREGGGTAELGGDVCPAIRSGQGGGDKPHVMAFDTTQITSAANYRQPKPGPRPLRAAGAHAPAIASPLAVRRLTPTECCRLMGWPDDWNAWGLDEDGCRIKMSDSARYRQCGNGVVANVAEWIGRRIMQDATHRASMPLLAAAGR